jgi:hypothetical protein
LAFRGKVQIEDDPWNKSGSHYAWLGNYECQCGKVGIQRVSMSKRDQQGEKVDKPSDEYIANYIVECITKNHICAGSKILQKAIYKPDGTPWKA